MSLAIMTYPSRSDVFLHATSHLPDTACNDVPPAPVTHIHPLPISPCSFLPQKTSTPRRPADRKTWANTARRDQELGVKHQLSRFGGPPQLPSATYELAPLEMKRPVSAPSAARPNKRVSPIVAAYPPGKVEAQQRVRDSDAIEVQFEEVVRGDVGVTNEQPLNLTKQTTTPVQECDAAEGEFGDIDDKLARASERMLAVEDRARSATEQLSVASKDLQDAIARGNTLESENDVYKEEVHQLRAAKDSLEAKLGGLSAEYNQLQHECRKLSNSNQQLELMQKEGYAMAIQLMREKDQEITELEQEVFALQDEIKKVTSCSSSAAAQWTPFPYSCAIQAYTATTDESPLMRMARLLGTDRKAAQDDFVRIYSPHADTDAPGLGAVNPDVDNSLSKPHDGKAPILDCSPMRSVNVPATTMTSPEPCRDPPAYTSRLSNLNCRTQSPGVSDYPAASSTTNSNNDSSVIQEGNRAGAAAVRAPDMPSDETAGGVVAMACEATGERDVLVGSCAKARAGEWRRGRVALFLFILFLVWIVVHRGDIRGPFGQL